MPRSAIPVPTLTVIEEAGANLDMSKHNAVVDERSSQDETD